MAFCLCEIFIWSMKNQYCIPDDLVGCHVYHDKGEQVNSQEHLYSEEKQLYTESQDMVWFPRNKRPERLRDGIKEVEDLLAQHRCVQVRWRSRQLVQLVLGNASIVSMVVSGHCGDVERIFVDKSMVGKFSSEAVCDAFLTDQYMVACHADMPRIEYAFFSRRPSITEAAKRLDKLSTWEPKVVQIDIPGPRGRRLERKFSANIRQDMLLVWFSVASNEPWPWSPHNSETERANLVVLTVVGPMIEVKNYFRTEGDPVYAGFSAIKPSKIFTVEQTVGAKGDVMARICVLEIINEKIQTTSVVTVPLKGKVECQARSPSEDRLLLGCSDGSMVLYDQHKKVTLFTRGALNEYLHYVNRDDYVHQVPTCMAWHPGGSIVFAASSRGDIQVFDAALTPLTVQFVTEDVQPDKFLKISRLFRTSVNLRSLDWCLFDPQSSENVSDYKDVMFLNFDKGPPALLMFHLGVVSRERFSAVELTKEYLKNRQVDEAVSLLTALNWDSVGSTCYSCLAAIVNHLLRQPLNADREAQLEATLATFYAPKPALSETTILEYRHPISRLARRFFHLLLRYARFDKAFLLAVDIGSRDLFMDLHYMAQDKGETALAEVAKKKAQQVDTEAIDTLDMIDHGLNNERESYHGDSAAYAYQQPAAVENFIDQLPPSRQHPWQHEYYSSQSGATSHRATTQNRRAPDFATHYSNSENVHRDFELGGDLIGDYTAALTNSSSQFTQQHSLAPGEQNDKEEGTAAAGSQVKVIHFGIV